MKCGLLNVVLLAVLGLCAMAAVPMPPNPAKPRPRLMSPKESTVQKNAPMRLVAAPKQIAALSPESTHWTLQWSYDPKLIYGVKGFKVWESEDLKAWRYIAFVWRVPNWETNYSYDAGDRTNRSLFWKVSTLPYWITNQ